MATKEQVGEILKDFQGQTFSEPLEAEKWLIEKAYSAASANYQEEVDRLKAGHATLLSERESLYAKVDFRDNQIIDLKAELQSTKSQSGWVEQGRREMHAALNAMMQIEFGNWGGKEHEAFNSCCARVWKFDFDTFVKQNPEDYQAHLQEITPPTLEKVKKEQQFSPEPMISVRELQERCEDHYIHSEGRLVNRHNPEDAWGEHFTANDLLRFAKSKAKPVIGGEG